MSGGLQDYLTRGRSGAGAALQDLRHPNVVAQQYVNLIGSAIATWPRIYDSADRATIQSPMFWWQIRSDPIFSWAIQKRRQDVSGLEFWLKPADDTKGARIVANRLDWIIRKTPDFTLSRYELCSGIFRGSSMAAITGDRQWLKAPGDAKGKIEGDNRLRPWWIPGRLVDVDRWRFALAPDPEKDGELYWQFYSFKRKQWERLTRPEHFVWFFYENPESALGYGYGLNAGLYAYLKAKEIVLNLTLRGVRRWAMGQVVAAVDTMQRMGDERGATSSEEIGQAYADRLSALNSEDVLVHDKADEVRVLQGGGEGSQIGHQMLEYLDRGALRYITHGDLTGGTGQEGAERGNAITQKQGQSEGFAWDVARLEEALTISFVAQCYRSNRRNLEAECAAAGVPLGEAPHLKLGRAQEEQKPLDALNTIEKAQKVGMRVPESWAYERAGIPMPQEGDEDAVLEPPGAGPPMGAPAMGMAGMPGDPMGAPPMDGMPDGGDLGVEFGQAGDVQQGEPLDTSEIDAAMPPDMGAEPMPEDIPPDDGEPMDDAPPEDDDPMQDDALNGAQVSSLVEIVKDVAAGTIPRESAVAIIVRAFAMSPEDADALLGPAGRGFEPPEAAKGGSDVVA